jgi:ubiquinone/menaquinone biosynthesis C-methylase UbiE
MEQPNNQSSVVPLAFPKRIIIVLLRLFFKLLYHQFAFLYDWVATIVSLGMWQKWVTSVLPYLNGPDTLEIGFGPGHLQVALSQKEINIFGLDESNQMTRIAHRRLTILGLRSHLIRGDAKILPFADNCFHQVVLTFPAEYILSPNSLTEIHRVLANGGMAIMLPLAWITGQKPLERLMAWVNRITGEAPDWNEKSLEPLRQVGFDVSWELINNDSNKILIIKMHKN